MRLPLLLAVAALLGACQQADVEEVAATDRQESPQEVLAPEGLKPGSNEMLRARLESVEDAEVIVSDVIIPPDSEVPWHYHPGEEVLYVLEGSALHREKGKPDRVIKAGETYVIPPEAAHSPRGGPQGARAIVFRVHKPGQPERYPLPE